MKLHSFLLKSAVLIAAAAAILWSCSSEISFDEDSFDSSMTFGGDSLAVPVGSTDVISLDDFLSVSDGGLIQKNSEGEYFIEFTQSFEEHVDVNDIISNTDIPEVSVDFEEYVDFGDHHFEIEADGRYRMEIESTGEPVTHNVDLTSLQEYVSSIDRIELAEGTELNFEASGFPDGTDVEVTVSVPEHYVFEQGGQEVRSTLVFSGTSRYGDVRFEPVGLKSLNYNLQEGMPFELEEVFNIENIVVVIDPDEVYPGLQSFRFSLNIDKPYPSAFYGKVNISLRSDYDNDPYEDMNNWISLDGLPSFLKSDDVVLDFSSPHIEMSVESNVGVPMTVDASLTPYYGEDSGEPLYFSLDSPFCLNPDEPSSISYWFADECPSDLASGYEYRQAAISRFMRRIPDRIFIDINGESDKNSEEEHYIDFTENDYSVKADIRFNMPLEFGNELYLPASDTLYGMPDILSTVLQSANITVTGNVESAFPVDVELSAYFLDYENRRVVSLANSSVIKAANADGTPTVSPLELTVQDVADGSSINALVIEFALSGADTGLTLSDKAYVKVTDIVLKAPGGVTVNANIMNN